MSDSNPMHDFNQAIIEEFRANGGKVGGGFEGAPMVILHTTGAKTGKERVHPLVYRAHPDGWTIFASKAGAPTHPVWYVNLLANPEAVVEIGTETIPVTARVLEGAERSEVWEAQKVEMPGFAEYEKATDREIPVVLLTRR